MGRVYIEYLGDCVEIPVGETVIGRGLGCMLRFNDPSVSRRHVRFIRREDEMFVEDLGSSNGTLVNGDRVTRPVRVQDGDLLVVGSRQLVVRLQNAPSDEPPTLTLRELAALDGASTAHRHATTKLPATAPPPPSVSHQRCPACGAPVATTDDECAACHFRWGNFRPSSATAVGASPLVRRRHERHSIELPLVYSSSELEIEATSRDLSESGVFVFSEVLDPVGTPCHLTIMLDGGPPLQLSGIVRRVVERSGLDNESGIGIEFVEVGEAERGWLKTMVDRMLEAELAASLAEQNRS